MKSIVLSLSLFLWVSLSLAALPPRYQNERDLSVMLDFINKYPVDVLGNLRQIDLENKTVVFGQQCLATFRRAPQKKTSKVMVGPASELVFDHSTCKVAH